MPSMSSVPCYTLEFFFLPRKGILDEYSQITSLVTEEIVNVHKEIQTSVEQIDPNSEYNDFIDTHRYTFLSWWTCLCFFLRKLCIKQQHCLNDSTWTGFCLVPFTLLLVKLYPSLKIVLLARIEGWLKLDCFFNHPSLWLALEKQNSSHCYYMWRAVTLVLTVDYTWQSRFSVSYFTMYLDAVYILG